jgi:hypothetical protein
MGQEHSISVGEPITEVLLPRSARKEKKRTDSTAVQEQPGAQRAKQRTILYHPILLTPVQAQYLLTVLQEHEPALKQMAEADWEKQEKQLERAYERIFQIAREHEAKQTDLSARAYPWQHNPDSQTWTCDLAPHRVTVFVSHFLWTWQACLERPKRPKRENIYFNTFVEAVTWGEDRG